MPTVTESDLPRRQIAGFLAEHYAELAGIRPRPAPPFSLARVILGDIGPREKEVLTGAAMDANREYNPTRHVIPWSALTRDMTVAGVSGSQHLVGTQTVAAADALRPYSIVAQAGVTVLDNLRSNIAIPRTAGDATGYWLSTENSAVTPSQPELGQVPLTPKTWGCLVTMSHTFLKASDQAEAYVRRELLRVAGRALDAAVLGGSGVAGEPQGLVHIAAIPTTSGSGFAADDALAMREDVASAGADDSRVAWVSTAAVRALLGARPELPTTGTSPLWAGDRMTGRPAFVSADAPSGTLFLADWSKVIVGLWNSGFELMTNPYADMSRGYVQMRIMLTCDVAIVQTDAAAISTSIS